MPSAGRLRYLEMPAAAGTPARRGQGTLVLLHAFPINARMWEPQLALAQQGWRVIAPQLRGFDGSAGEPPVGSMDDYAGDIVDLLDGLHIDEAVFGGLSMGGYVAFALLRNAPRYFRGLILADTRSQADTPEARQGRQKMLGRLIEHGVGAIADDMIPRLLGESTLKANPALAERLRSLIQSNSAEAVAGAIKALMTRSDSTALLSTIHVPTLVLVGEEDVITPPALSHEMHGAIAGSELVTISKAGHLSNLEQPEAFNAAVSHFLSHRV